MTVTKAVLEALFKWCPVEDRVRFERISLDAKVAVHDSWWHKNSLTRHDKDWLRVPGPKRCQIISKMSSLKKVDIAWAVNGLNETDHENVVQEIIKSCPIIRQIYNDRFYETNLQVRYLEHYGADCKLEMLDAHGIPVSKLKSLKRSHPMLKITWLNNGGMVPEEVTHLVSTNYSPVNILTGCDPTRLKFIQSFEIESEINSGQIAFICDNFPKLKSFVFRTAETTHTVIKSLMLLDSLDVLNITKLTKPIARDILEYFESGKASNLKSLTLIPCNLSVNDMVTIIPPHLPHLEFVKITTGCGLVLSYLKETLMITWTKTSLESVFNAFPKCTSFCIQTPQRINAYWTPQFKRFAGRRKNKLIKVIYKQTKRAAVEMEEEFDNLLIIV